MASRIVEGASFSEDIQDFLRLLARRRVRYLIVGGEAVIYHGHARLTGDIDFFYQNTPENIRRLYRALQEFWAGEIPGVGSADELSEPGIILQFGRPPHRIDLMNQIDGVRFVSAWPLRIRVRLDTRFGLLPVTYIDSKSLLKNKRSTGRARDLDDARYLAAQLQRRHPRPTPNRKSRRDR
jgi:hypothetical protein